MNHAMLRPGQAESTAISGVNPWTLYLIRAAGGELYTGITTDVDRRFDQHRAGRGAKYLRSRTPLAVVYRREIGGRGLALKVERRIKLMNKAEKESIVRARPNRRSLLRILPPAERRDSREPDPR